MPSTKHTNDWCSIVPNIIFTANLCFETRKNRVEISQALYESACRQSVTLYPLPPPPPHARTRTHSLCKKSGGWMEDLKIYRPIKGERHVLSSQDGEVMRQETCHTLTHTHTHTHARTHTHTHHTHTHTHALTLRYVRVHTHTHTCLHASWHKLSLQWNTAPQASFDIEGGIELNGLRRNGRN